MSCAETPMVDNISLPEGCTESSPCRFEAVGDQSLPKSKVARPGSATLFRDRQVR